MASEPKADRDGSAGEVEGAEDGRSARASRRRAERREAILAAAKRVFRSKGYHEVSVHDIIDDAQIARGTFYLYFSSKQELLSELAEEFLLILRRQVRRISLQPGSEPPLLQLQANFRRVVQAVWDHEDVASIILRDPINFDEETRARLGAFFDQVRQMVADALRVGQGLGLLRACDVELVAVTALGGVREALGRLIRERGDDPVAPERVADELMHFFLGGLMVSPASRTP